MHFTLADLHHYVLPSDRQLLDAIEIRAIEAKAREIEALVRGCMARMPPEREPKADMTWKTETTSI